MTTLSLVLYVVVLSAFAAILYQQSTVVYKDTIVSVTDMTSQGYTCTMASIYNGAPTQVDDSLDDPHTYYQLINVNELKSQCEANLNKAAPCDQSLNDYLYNPGVASELNKMVVAASAYGNTTISMISQLALNSNTFTVSEYNIAAGKVKQLGKSFTPSSFYVTSLIGRSYNNHTAYINSAHMYVDSSPNSVPIIFNNTTLQPLAIANDNDYNLYVLATYISQVYIFAIDIQLNYYGAIEVAVQLGLQYSITNQPVISGNGIQSFAVYKSLSTGNITVYSTYQGNIYVNTWNNSFELYYKNGQFNWATVQIAPNGDSLMATTNSGSPQIYQLSLQNNKTMVLGTNKAGGICLRTYVSSIGYVPSGFSLLNNQTLFGSCYLTSLDVVNGGMVLLDVSTRTFTNILFGYQYSSAGWFACEDQLLGAFPNSLTSGTGSTNCSRNGIIWRITFESDNYYYTLTDMELKARTVQVDILQLVIEWVSFLHLYAPRIKVSQS